MNFEICALCREEAEIQNSHILPSAAHLHSKNSVGRNTMVEHRRGVVRLINQSDIKEPLLCFDCEQLISNFEGIAIKTCRLAWRHRTDSFFEIPAAYISAMVKLAYSVFWRSSVSKIIQGYQLSEQIQSTLRQAFYTEILPEIPTLAISVSFFEVLDIPVTDRILFTPIAIPLSAMTEVHYFSMFGIVFRMNVPSAPFELEDEYFLRPEKQSGRIYPLQPWEETMFAEILIDADKMRRSPGL
jgi:hypothetical protein